MIDYKKAFNALPGNYLIVLPNPPEFTVVAVNDSYLKATEVKREEVLNKPLFVAYPEDPNGSGSGTKAGQDLVRESLLKVIETRKFDQTGVIRYDIPVNCTREFTTKYWSPTHTPLLDENGNLLYIIEEALDVTHLVQLGLRVVD